MVVAHQVTEAMKILVDDFETLRGTMLSFDIWNNQFLSLKVNKQKKVHVHLAEIHVRTQV